MKIFGPYKGSKQNGGRPIFVIKRKKKDGTTVTTSTNKARKDYEDANGNLPRNVDVDHLDNKGRAGSDSLSNLKALSHKKNVAKENTRRGTAKKAAVKKTVKKKP